MLKFSNCGLDGGYTLPNDFICESPIMVLTGLNGAGKTRFALSVKNGAIPGCDSVCTHMNGELLDFNNITYLDPISFSPSFTCASIEDGLEWTISKTISCFESEKTRFAAPYDPSSVNVLSSNYIGEGLSYHDMHVLCEYISNKLGKPVSDLKGSDIGQHFEMVNRDIFQPVGFSTICRRYIARRTSNMLAIIKNERFGKNIDCVRDEDFEEVYGVRPWLLMNDLLKDVFGGKFSISIPDEDADELSYEASLLDAVTGKLISLSSVSSGEKTLLWLALLLFKIKYGVLVSVPPPKLLILDEPDAFLHPKMVVKMYQVLNFFASTYGTHIIVISHSPTTVALAPENSVFLASPEEIVNVDKDLAIAGLLDGVSQISISSKNRRQIFVESLCDVNIYNELYAYMQRKPSVETSKISLSFISSGEKMPAERIGSAVKKVFGDEVAAEKIYELEMILNGVGSCSHVLGVVEKLVNSENNDVRGLVDWDNRNTSSDKIVVIAEGFAYTLENIALDPICMMLMLNLEGKCEMVEICGEDISVSELLARVDLLQEVLDRFFLKLYGRNNDKKCAMSYISGITLKTDSQYLSSGKKIIDEVLLVFNSIKACYKPRGGHGLSYFVVSKGMIKISEGKLIPLQFQKAFDALRA